MKTEEFLEIQKIIRGLLDGQVSVGKAERLLKIEIKKSNEAYHENELKAITREKILEGMSEYTEGKKDKQTHSRAFIKGCNYVLKLLNNR